MTNVFLPLNTQVPPPPPPEGELVNAFPRVSRQVILLPLLAEIHNTRNKQLKMPQNNSFYLGLFQSRMYLTISHLEKGNPFSFKNVMNLGELSVFFCGGISLGINYQSLNGRKRKEMNSYTNERIPLSCAVFRWDDTI